MKKNFLLISLVLLITPLLNAQITSGTISMSFKDFETSMMEDAENSEIAMVKGMMESMSMVMHFRPGRQVTHISMMGMMNIYQHFEGETMTQYMDVMGQKIKVVSPLNDMSMFDSLGIAMEDIKDLFEIEYHKDDTKSILDYNCYRVDIVYDIGEILKEKIDGDELEGNFAEMGDKIYISMYITDEIRMDRIYMQNMPGLQLDGTPLSMTLDMGIMKLIMEATSFTATVDPTAFDPPEGEYHEMSIEELQKMGMNPGAMGF